MNNHTAEKPARSQVIRFSRGCVVSSMGWGDWGMGIDWDLSKHYEMLTVVILLLSVTPDRA